MRMPTVRMPTVRTVVMVTAAAALVAGCEHQHQTGAAKEAAVEPMVEAVEEDAGTSSATVAVGLDANNKLHFASAGYYSSRGGGTQSGILLDSGEVDISNLPPGDVTFTITLNDDAYDAGYRFPSDPWQAVAIAYWEPGNPNPPTPVFGESNWPAEFTDPAVTADLRTLNFIDHDNDDAAYEYSIAVNGPGGRYVLDPKVQNGGQDK